MKASYLVLLFLPFVTPMPKPAAHHITVCNTGFDEGVLTDGNSFDLYNFLLDRCNHQFNHLYTPGQVDVACRPESKNHAYITIQKVSSGNERLDGAECYDAFEGLGKCNKGGSFTEDNGAFQYNMTVRRGPCGQ